MSRNYISQQGLIRPKIDVFDVKDRFRVKTIDFDTKITFFSGFDHEQNRPDRDQYVIMHWEKIRDDKKWNFQIMTNGEWKSTGHEYDFQSVMHYSSKNFAKDGVGPTMTRRVSHFSASLFDKKNSRFSQKLANFDLQTTTFNKN